ncbi:5814_t:CDS:2 [Paraglomus occultum]|uniref:5814_t:CDS:1 n=1 Tax=Paraglomus occultum TaxID=144539 RepID=A0A9N9CTG6_9GLOM|nr:5814_t:CDS:2 [Paraglomus occultum]
MSHPALWIRLEDSNRKRATRFPIVDGIMSHDLDDLAVELCKKGRFQTLKIDSEDLEFFGDYDKSHYDDSNSGSDDGDDGPLRSDIQLQHLKTTAKAPLIVRYPLSNRTIIVNVKLANAQQQIHVGHDTGAWENLIHETEQRYSTLQLDNTKFYFVDQATKKVTINSPFVFFDVAKRTKPKSEDEIVLDFIVRIEGKKAYGEWSIKDVLHELLQDQHKSINAIPKLDIDATFGPYEVDQEQEKFLKENLGKITKAFHYVVSNNEATTRNYINPIIIEAVSAVQKSHASVRLAVDEQFDGSKGYGRLDYVLFCEELAVVVTEAKMIDVQNRIAQNIAQLHTAVEESKKRKRSNGTPMCKAMYGIVTTANEWRFLNWDMRSSTPTVLLSKPYDCSFTNNTGVSEVLSVIIRILQSQANDIAGQSVEEGAETEERESQRRRLHESETE